MPELYEFFIILLCIKVTLAVTNYPEHYPSLTAYECVSCSCCSLPVYTAVFVLETSSRIGITYVQLVDGGRA